MTTPTPNALTFFEVTGHFYSVSDPSISGTQNTPVIQAVSGLATFTARLAKGRMLYVDNFLVTNAFNAVQTVNIIGNATTGTFKLQYGSIWTTAMPYNAANAAVQSALAAIPAIGTGNVLVQTGVNPQSYDVEYTNALGNMAIQPLNGDASLLGNAQGPGNCEITVTTSVTGTPQIVADTAIALPPITGRIWNGELSTIDYVDTPGVQLCANTPVLNFVHDDDPRCQCPDDLIYDVAFTQVTYDAENQVIAPFAFVAPIDATPVCITDPDFVRLPYAPTADMWTPPALQAVPAGAARDWRTRALRAVR